MWKRFSSMATVAVALVVLVLGSGSSFCQAQLISSFENNLSSSVGATWVGDTAPLLNYSEFVTTGATDGTTALAIHHSPNWTIQAILKGGLPLAQDAASHDFLLIDATTMDQGIAGDGWSPSWRQIFVVFNSNQGGWQQSQLDFPVAADDGGSLTSTLVLDLVSSGVKANAQAYVDSGGGNGTWWELFLPMQGGDQGTFAKAGDYGPADNLVNAADYVTWRKSVGGTTLANETVTPGSVDIADYTEWRANFGKDYSRITTIIDNVRFANAGSGSSGLSGAGVPEPSSVALILVAILALGSTRRVYR